MIIEKFYWTMPDDVLGMTHGGQLPWAAKPAGMEMLTDTSIASQLGIMMRIRDERGALIGLGSELEVWSGGDSMVGLTSSDADPDSSDTPNECHVWLSIVTRDRGSLFGYETKHFAEPTMTRLFQHVAENATEWTGSERVVTTNGPAERRGIVVAGTGDFAGLRGTFTQTVDIRRIPLDGEATMIACEEFHLTPE